MAHTSELASVSTAELIHVLDLLINAQPTGIKASKNAIREVLADRLLSTSDSVTG